MGPASKMGQYDLRVKNIGGATLRGRINGASHKVLCETATGGVYAEPGDLILILPNEHCLVLRKDDYPYLVNVLPAAVERLIADAARASERFGDDELEAHARALANAGEGR
jgi:hypothetical protein